jgi:hypothetical protein
MGNFLSDYTGIDIDFLNPQSYTNSSNPIAPLLLAAGLQTTGLGTGTSRPTGYQGEIKDYTAVRERVPDTYDPNRRPGSGGQRYFTQTQFKPTADVTPAEPMTATGLAALNKANPARQTRQTPVVAETDTLMGDNASKAASSVIDLMPLPTYDEQGNTINPLKSTVTEGQTRGFGGRLPIENTIENSLTLEEMLANVEARRNEQSVVPERPNFFTKYGPDLNKKDFIKKFNADVGLETQDYFAQTAKRDAAYKDYLSDAAAARGAELQQTGASNPLLANSGISNKEIIDNANKPKQTVDSGLASLGALVNAGKPEVQYDPNIHKNELTGALDTSKIAANTLGMAAGGIAELKKGQYLGGATDGMADKIPANIDGVQEAALSDGEFVIPADVVSHLGNGNSDAGAKVLDKMMARVRKARTGNNKQGKEINPKKFLPA